jgi:hypothetical protein
MWMFQRAGDISEARMKINTGKLVYGKMARWKWKVGNT